MSETSLETAYHRCISKLDELAQYPAMLVASEVNQCLRLQSRIVETLGYRPER